METNDVCSVSEEISEEDDIVSRGNQCIECQKTFSSFANLSRHMRNFHCKTDDNVIVKFDHRRSQICPICSEELISIKSYENHLLEEHDTKLDKVNLEFVSSEAFCVWKATIEKKNSCMYVKTSGTRNIGATKLKYLYCHRSGGYRGRGKGKRSLKSTGTNKIEKTCPSKMKVIFKDDKVHVEYIKTHLGHSFDLERMKKISEEEKKSLAEKLASGMTISQVLDSVKRTHNKKKEPIQLLTKKDLENIKKKFNIKGVSKKRCSKEAVEKSKKEKSVA